MSIAIRENSTPNTKPDGYLDSLAKLVPGEVIAGYTAAIQFKGIETVAAHWIVAALFTILTPTILFLASRGGLQPKLGQYTMRTAAFLLVALGTNSTMLGSMKELQWIPGVGGVLVAALAAYIIKPPTPPTPPTPIK